MNPLLEVGIVSGVVSGFLSHSSPQTRVVYVDREVPRHRCPDDDLADATFRRIFAPEIEEAKQRASTAAFAREIELAKAEERQRLSLVTAAQDAEHAARAEKQQEREQYTKQHPVLNFLFILARVVFAVLAAVTIFGVIMIIGVLIAES